MRCQLTVSAIFSTLIFPHSSFALQGENQFRCLNSDPTTEQNIEVNIAECSYLHAFEAGKITDSLLLYPLLSLGAVMTEEGQGALIGGGGGINYGVYRYFGTFFEGGTYWLTNVIYGERGKPRKNYGGNVQFFAKLGVNYTFTSNWAFGYAYMHLSNGNRYEHNPSFDGHSVTIGYRF